MLGRIYLLLLIILKEARKSTSAGDAMLSPAAAFERLISRPQHYVRMNSYPGEISAASLATSALKSLTKMKNDYKIGSFFNLLEWRSSETAILSPIAHQPDPRGFKVIINDENTFSPSPLHSMDKNSESLSSHLKRGLCLSNEDEPIDSATEIPQMDKPLLNSEIFFYAATQHNLPIFISIDGGLDQGIATVSITILAPDIHPQDNDLEWQDRPARALLVRSWQLPQTWGSSTTCINMAESMGFIFGEYTIPSDLPIIYITDSNNARTLQRNLKDSDSFTHRKMIRSVMQGIDSSIAHHLKFLTSKWPKWEELSSQVKDIYKRGEALCRSWAKKTGSNRYDPKQ